MNLPLVDIVILNYNGRRFLNECLGSVLRGSYPNQQVYLLDNASTEDDVDYVAKHFPNVKIIRNLLNNGYCAAYNLAFSVCTGKYIVFLNNDVTVAPDWVDHMVALAESDAEIAALQPKIVSYFNEHQFEYAGASGGLMDKYGYPFLRGRVFDSIEDDNGQYNDSIEVFWTSGAAMFIKRECLYESGTLDETIVHHMDEIDLCWRLRMAGYKLKVQPLSVIRHIGGATIQTHSYKKVYWNHRNSLYIMLKNYGLANMLTKVPVHIALDWVAIMQALVTFNFTTVRGVLAAHVWLVLNVFLIFRKRQEVQQKRKLSDSIILSYLYPGSIVWEYFIKGRKTCQSLKHYKHHENTLAHRKAERFDGFAAGIV